MPHDTSLISTIVGGLVLAFIFGAIANRFRLPPLVGYLVAGMLVGPHTPGFVADQELAPQLAELGVILLMFGVGLHFALKDLLSVRFIAVPGAVGQIAIATLFGWGLGHSMGWSTGGSLIFGLALSVASTVVLLKALQERRLVDSERGKIAVGWLIVEDLAMVLVLVLIPAAASVADGGASAYSDPLAAIASRLVGIDLGVGGIVAATLTKVAIFVALMLVVGRRVIPAILHRIAHTGSRELFRLGVLAIALGVAFGAAELFGASLALGAFFAGMVLSESELSHRAAQESLPLRDAFSVLFFVSVGMLFDPNILINEPLVLLATLAIILIGKTVAAFAIVLIFRRPVKTALTISASLAQIGEFSFILAEMGVGLGFLPEEGRDLILAGALISIILNPLMFGLADRLRPTLEGWLQPKSESEPVTEAAVPAAATKSEPTQAEGSGDLDDEAAEPTTLTGHLVVVGYGRVGSVIADDLTGQSKPLLVIEDGEDRLRLLRDKAIETIAGNAADGRVLALAGLERAKALLVAIPEGFEAGQVVEQARRINASLLIVARAHSNEEVEHLLRHGADRVIMGEREIALGMLKMLDGETTQPHGAADKASPSDATKPSDTEEGKPAA
ncbi:Kef family K(+) transporter [Pleomorphomonas diazotrophica]|uniref:Kef family K(+) transporter n=1 Tax=Pleomorphomonas diazotrophica TaxID=1166257 RepID=A0A1I4RXA5_9HYPH|nr:YbaL family putative K(+) efflux transporter [Pleomorphomonas diazotrophica]PKR87983.1 Kef family K(+) transporter [Pleomorphomonas diazotrophica]SFM56916.1 Kef-type potassium/proton antiporter, CPA2 family [Pleomorphomonas diazotrophica]